jgi:hypothetical protein
MASRRGSGSVDRVDECQEFSTGSKSTRQALRPRRRVLPNVLGLLLVTCVWAFVPAPPSPATTGKSACETAAPCNYYYEWIGRTRFPLQADPHATYTYVAPSSDAARHGIGFLVRGQFVHSAWTSWLTYDAAAQPFSGANFVDNPPKSSYHPVVADPGSLSPFSHGQPMLGTPRNFTLLFVPDGYEGPLSPSLDGTPTAQIDRERNWKRYPSPEEGSAWVLANRNYQAFPGYNPGGTTKSTFPVVTAVHLATGERVNCQAYNLLPDRLQRPPGEPPDELNYGFVPRRIPLKDGSHLDPIGGLGGTGRSWEVQYAPRNPPGLLQFTRPPLAPGADVAEVPPPERCAGYLGTRTNPRRISLVRIPRIANFTDTRDLTSSTYPNPVDRHRPWQAAYVSLSMYGRSSGLYLPGRPRTSSIAGHEFMVDRTGGSTVLIWPRRLSARERSRVFRYAARKRWPLVRGGTAGPETTANVLIRLKGTTSDYHGRFSNQPCFFGGSHNEDEKRWTEVPVHRGSKWVASAKNLGAAAPQGVTCGSPRELTSGRCLDRLKRHMRRTGGRYITARR